MALFDLGRPGAGGAKPRLVMIVADPGRESAAAMEWALGHAVADGDDILLLHVNMPHPNTGAAAGPSRSSSGGGASSPLAGVFRSGSSSSSSSSSSSGSAAAGDAGGGAGCGDQFMEAMRAACLARHPRARVRAERVDPATEGREAKAQTILAEAQRRGVELLVIGQRRLSSFLGYVLHQPTLTFPRSRLAPQRLVAGFPDDLCVLSRLRGGAGGSGRGHDTTPEFLIEHSKCLCVSVQKKGQNAGYLLNTKTHKNFWLLA